MEIVKILSYLLLSSRHGEIQIEVDGKTILVDCRTVGALSDIELPQLLLLLELQLPQITVRQSGVSGIWIANLKKNATINNLRLPPKKDIA